MVTQNPLPPATIPVRGSVQRTFVPARILSGFTDPLHFEQLAGEYLSTLDGAARTKVLADADATRGFVAALPPLQPTAVVTRPISGPHVASIQSHPLFQQMFGQLPHQFAYVDPSKLVALQATIEPRADPVPSSEAELLEWALPTKWDVPVELNFSPPLGPIQILSSNPALQGFSINVDQATGRVFIGAPQHLNLVQVMHFQGRHYLRNGYHRVADAIAAGASEIPAIVVQAFLPQEVALAGNTFNIAYVMARPRPPLVADFHTPAAVTAQIRERRYGYLVSLDFKPLNIGI